ncbi:dimethylarginine dimethylaminohydrolase family protein [Radiobacillus sp. PE A8.2]|uniref:dimethylarginine dimethylaminohydrolase family protein n=1 Tax=Radiobacillus sp. PE A8.2 TaxID=3380349 RepID=UPI00388E8053
MSTESHQQTNKVAVKTEYGRLEKVILCPPENMKISEIINETQKRYKSENIDVDVAMQQYQSFANLLRDHGVEVIELDTQQELNEQVFTRDIGFTIGDHLFISSMGSGIREGEITVLKQRLDDENINYHDLAEYSIEGGDVILDDDRVWIGVSNRTTIEAINYLQQQLPDYQIIPMPINEKILHLDCAFNILSENQAIVFPDAFTEEDLAKIKQHFEIIEVTEEEQFTLGTNVLSIGDNKIIGMPKNASVNKKLAAKGFDILEVPFSEIIKSGGSFRCCSLPLRRS